MTCRFKKNIAIRNEGKENDPNEHNIFFIHEKKEVAYREFLYYIRFASLFNDDDYYILNKFVCKFYIHNTCKEFLKTILFNCASLELYHNSKTPKLFCFKNIHLIK